jgi:hypothetical protein
MSRDARALLTGLCVALTAAATGIEWWQRGTYRLWTENPPLPKVIRALAPYLGSTSRPATPSTGSRATSRSRALARRSASIT